MPPRTKPQTPTNNGKYLFYIIEAIAFQTIIIVTILLTLLHKTPPKLRFQALAVEKLTVNATSFSFRLHGEVTLRNPNFGQFKFPEGKVVILYRNNSIGGAVIPAGRVKARSAEKMNVTVVAEAGDFGGEGKVTLSSNAVLSGRIRVSKRRVKATMNCTMDVDTRRGSIDQFKCD
ncbi:hypothetical protein AAHA92_32312 [Salvia divinorum]|uniref:Late embryogenesis abundant protein LEA-2 subgroup domain-containing protein n=1 Tax=Salvia divinorum TaxID=28513 RepID=A0ABD1FMF6_SALDI